MGLLWGTQNQLVADAAPVPANCRIIPRPVRMECGQGEFTLAGKTVISTPRIVATGASRQAGQFLADRLVAAGVPVRLEARGQEDGAISLSVSPDFGLGTEGYELEVTPRRIRVKASGAAGAFYAVQTLRQLLPPEIESGEKLPGAALKIPCVKIVDKTRLPYRGLMLDPARYFIEKAEVLKIIDGMSYYKLNRLHLHLTDSTGWRIEIKKYPRLTDSKNWPITEEERGRGFYTQEDMREIVRYAQSRHVMVIPELEMPQHSVIATRMCPELLCREGATEDAEICAGSDRSHRLLCDIVDELVAIFPAPYLHIGGDEYLGSGWAKCPDCKNRIRTAQLEKEDNPDLAATFAKASGKKNKYLLYRYLMRRVAAHVRSRGRIPVLWDDLAWQGKPPEGAMILQWHYKGGMDFFVNIPWAECPAFQAASKGHDVVASPFSHLYLDLPCSVEKIYGFEPVPVGLTKEQERHVLGAQANNWDCPADQLEFRVFPKVIALAEITWSPKSSRDYLDFSARLARHYPRLDAMKIAFERDPRVDSRKIGSWTPASFSNGTAAVTCDISAHLAKAGEYIISPCYTKGNHAVNIEWIALLEDGTEIGRDTHVGQSGYSHVANSYRVRLPARKPGAIYRVLVKLTGMGGEDSHGDVYMFP